MNLLFSFLLGFPFQEEIPASDELKDDLNSTSARKGKKCDANAAETAARIKALKMSDKNYITPIMGLKQTFKLQYSLPSGEDKKKTIQIVYYGTCAELTFQNVSTMIKCVIVEDVAFLAFTVMHQINTTDLHAPVHIKSQSIQFGFTQIKNDNKTSKVANKLFYYFSTDDYFGYLIETEDGELPERIDQMAQKCGKKDYIFSSPCKFHWKNLNVMINRASSEIKSRRILYKKNRCAALLGQSNQEEPKKVTAATRDSRTVKSGRTGKSEKLKPPDMTLTFGGENLVYEKAVWTTESYSELLNEELIYTGSLMTNTGVYTTKQRNFLKSLSFHIKSIQNIPPSVIEKHKVDRIYLEYSFLPVFKVERCHPIELESLVKLKIKEVRTFFNDELRDDKLIEAIQSNLLVLKICGVREKSSNIKTPRVWGQDLSCTKFAMRFNQFIDPSELEKENAEQLKKEDHKTGSQKSKSASKKSKKAAAEQTTDFYDDINEESVVLGYSTVSLYELMKYSFRMTATAPITSTFLPASSQLSTPLRPMNVMHFHQDHRRPQRGIVEIKDYIEHKTTIKIEVKLGCDLAKNVLHKVLTYPTLFAVCIIIDYDTRSSYGLLKGILEHNKTILNEGRTIPNIIHQNLGISPEIKLDKKPQEIKIDDSRKSFTERHTAEKDQNYFTGFMVDCIDFSIIMIESLEVQAISKILVHRYQMLTEEGKMLYNSNLVFTERLYDDFLKFGGIFLSALGLPLDATLNHKLVQKYVPAPALRCLQTLKTISASKNVRRNILPTPLELLSMDAEFGVPLHKVETFHKR